MASNNALARAQQNMAAQQILLANSVRMVQNIYSGTVNVANNPILNVSPRNVGLTLGFIVEVECNITNGATNPAALTGFGGANLVKQFTYTDLNNVNRIQTTGYHMAMLNSARQGFAFGGAYNPQISLDLNNNYPVIEGAGMAADANDDFRYVWYIPLAYAADDLRGAVYTNVINATQNLQIVLNQEAQAFVATGADPLNAVLIGNANANYTDNEVTVNVYQIYRDQIPFAEGVPVLPIDSLNLVYDIKNLSLSGMSENQDFPFAYPNMRQFYSTFAIYDNGGQFNVGTDINYWSLLSANQTQLFKVSPLTAALFARQTFMADVPPGVYYFDSRDKPIDTITFGNMTLNLNASDVQSGANLIVCTEAFQQVNQIPYASSLAVAG